MSLTAARQSQELTSRARFTTERVEWGRYNDWNANGSANSRDKRHGERTRETAPRDATRPTSRSPLFRTPVGEVGPTGRHPVPSRPSRPSCRAVSRLRSSGRFGCSPFNRCMDPQQTCPIAMRRSRGQFLCLPLRRSLIRLLPGVSVPIVVTTPSHFLRAGSVHGAERDATERCVTTLTPNDFESQRNGTMR